MKGVVLYLDLDEGESLEMVVSHQTVVFLVDLEKRIRVGGHDRRLQWSWCLPWSKNKEETSRRRSFPQTAPMYFMYLHVTTSTAKSDEMTTESKGSTHQGRPTKRDPDSSQ
ncbi:putative translational activator GCN1 [Sesbania bispinosa]|nr:putative translational activator GCN1 [Sesbania bispinosa]